MRYIFIGFYGWPENPINQEKLASRIDEDFECWNLKKCSLEEFIVTIKQQIPPINNNVLKNYIANKENDFGISEKLFKQCNWGLLLPNPAEYGNNYGETISVVNLYSTHFMRPAFYVSDFGINIINEIPGLSWLFFQDKSDLFKSPNFVSFYNVMLPQAKYFRWFRDDTLSWNDEDWRLFMAASFYKDLEEYENSKPIYTWQRESADMATLLETLLTAGESDREEIGYRLRKRAFALIGWKFPNIEKGIKFLYKDRSEFVHGSYFKKIIEGMKKNKDGDPAMPPPPDFSKLYRMKEYIRFTLVAYLYLHTKRTSGQIKFLNTFKNIQEALEEAILNTELRQKLKEIIRPIMDLMPEEKRGQEPFQN